VPPLPVCSGREAIRAFERAGWRQARQVGSHVILTHPRVAIRLSVPDHKELRPGLLRSLIRDAGLTVEDFVGLLGRR